MDPLLLPLQLLLALLLAPLAQGVIKTVKARFQNRRGPGLLQPWRDILKLLARQSVVSEQASWVFCWAPFVYGGALVAAAALVPLLTKRSPAPSVGDAIVFVGLLALARFALALAALDTGSNFGGMGASREVTFAALVEPALLLVLFAVALPVGSTSLTALVGDGRPGAGDLLACAALLIVLVAETGRIPIDNPDTHLELTMAHEGMLLEYSGRPLGVLHWTTQVKQLAFLSLLAALFLPWGMAPAGSRELSELALGLGAWALKIVGLGLLLAIIETGYAKLRIFRAPDLLGLASVLGTLAVLATYVAGH
jgi:formate hydrogenlyase subunit 4